MRNGWKENTKLIYEATFKNILDSPTSDAFTSFKTLNLFTGVYQQLLQMFALPNSAQLHVGEAQLSISVFNLRPTNQHAKQMFSP